MLNVVVPTTTFLFLTSRIFSMTVSGFCSTRLVKGRPTRRSLTPRAFSAGRPRVRPQCMRSDVGDVRRDAVVLREAQPFVAVAHERAKVASPANLIGGFPERDLFEIERVQVARVVVPDVDLVAGLEGQFIEQLPGGLLLYLE